MKLFAIPVTKRHTLIYAHRLTTPDPKTLKTWEVWHDKVTGKAAKMWIEWGKDKNSTWNWKHRTVTIGNKILDNIPYTEYSLRTIPARPRNPSSTPTSILYPPALLKPHHISPLATSTLLSLLPYHRKWMWLNVVLSPLTVPFALLPVIPNIPFFVMAFRAWSHWKAMVGGKHLRALVENGELKPTPVKELEEYYKEVPKEPLPDKFWETSNGVNEDLEIILDEARIPELSDTLGCPEIAPELYRMITQLRKERDRKIVEIKGTNADKGVITEIKEEVDKRVANGENKTEAVVDEVAEKHFSSGMEKAEKEKKEKQL
ncbi:hypothetical protein YB2330_002548 [Saitoella coloradoensis]